MSILVAYDDKKDRISIFEYNDKMKNNIFCPENHSLIAKRGDKMKWHFCHKRKEDEDGCSCSKEKGEWHQWHQRRIKKEYIEIFYEKRKHIADCVNKDGLVIEFQKSTIPKDIIKEREDFYKNMIWVFCMDYHDFETINKHKNIFHLKLIKGSKYFLEAKKDSYLDYSHKQFLMKVISKKKTDILVEMLHLSQFDKLFLSDILKEDADKRIQGLYEDFELANKDEIDLMIKKFSLSKK